MLTSRFASSSKNENRGGSAVRVEAVVNMRAPRALLIEDQ
jgi:hypothetical protein